MHISPSLIIILALGLLSTPAGAATHHLQAGDSIQAALTAAAEGDTVRLTEGIYRENLVVDVPVCLLGEGEAEIRGGYVGHVVRITAPGVQVRGVQVSEAGTSLTQDMACILVEADDVTIRECRVTRCLHGIYVKGGNGARLVGNRIEGRLDLIEADRGNGIHLWNSRGNQVEDNEVLNVRDGIYFSFADSTTVVGNHIHGVRYGLHYMYSDHNLFRDNVFEHSVAGAALMYSSDIEFEGNVFAHCRGFRAYGVLYQSMDATRARRNLILDNSRGIFLNNSSHNVLADNDVVDNDLAIQLNGGCNGNRFSGNNVEGNLSDLILDVSDYDTEWDGEGGGNHWSSYRGYDLGADGLGDTPHEIQRVFQVMETRVPEVRFFAFSPAAAALEEAERALPILNLGVAQDHRPLIRRADNVRRLWETVEGRHARRSRPAAAAYLAASLMPVWLLARWSRARRGGRR